ncbi:hypothetical protein HYH02_012433 [Chlamydomonas schloesseri]|uniref:EF-hand domain-containing protein n=1 Tax=Chlamydomonas schloesseri TaxID=2026947 RepID=A0A835T9B6_9CHLO|nr:hypothetical protein HYH02_012433 [Chlamydomonas schloesseri]|eukprot:KAG2433971.1 hypothetical protein HYH02_012433 [Chlamydomonas schloesseri]
MAPKAVFNTTTRVMLLGFTAFVAISTYVLIVTHHVKLPTVTYSTTPDHREKIGAEMLHHSLLEDFSKYDVDGDSRLSIHEFANMLKDNQAKAISAQQQAAETQKQIHTVVEAAAKAASDVKAGIIKPGATGTGAGVAGGGSADLDTLDDGEYDDVEEYDLGAVTANDPDDADYEEPDDVWTSGSSTSTSTNGKSKTAGAKTGSKTDVDAEDEQGTTRQAGGADDALARAANDGADQKATAGDDAALDTTATTGAAVAAATANALAAVKAGATGCPDLSRQLVADFARDNTIMLTVADWRIFGSMGINWMKHLAKYGVDYWLVGATCVKTAQFLGHTGKHPCFKFYEDGSHTSTDQYKYGDSHYNAATWRKVVVVSRLVHWGFNVIHSDVDVVWFRDPLPYFLGPVMKNVDMAVSSDLISTSNPVGDDGLEVGMHQHTNFNTGVYFVRATPGGKSLMAGWSSMRSTNFHDNDQVGIYKFIRGRPARMDRRVLVLGMLPGEAEAAKRYEADPDNFTRTSINDPLPVSTEMRLGGLGVHMLLNGYSYFIPKLQLRMNVSSLGIHMTWVPLSKEGKFHRFRDGMLYDDPPEYYDAPDRRYLTADIEAPDAPAGFNTWRETEDMVQVHLKNMPPQLQQMYRAMAVAMVLNRTLIFPTLKCYCFKNWFMSEQCRIPGDKVTQFPLECALDQVFRPKVLYNYPPLNTSRGPQNFTFREYSMLDNSRTPAAVRNGQVLVVPEGEAPGNATGFVQVLSIKPNLRQDALVKALQPIHDAKVIRLRHVMKLFGGFDDAVLKASFEAFADAVTANWCCRDEPYIKKGLARKVKMVMTW